MVNSLMGKEIFRIFFIKYGHNQNWNIIITTDMTMNSRDETTASRAIKEELAVLRFSQGSQTGSHVLFSRLLLQTQRGELLRIHQYVFVETLTKDTNDVIPPHQSRWSSNVSLLEERTYTDFGAEVHRLWCGGTLEVHRLWYWLTFDLLLIYNICSVMKVTTQSLGHDNIFYFPTQIFNTSDYQCFTY